MDLSIVIVSYNTKDFLKKCLSSILVTDGKETGYEIIVVDNASIDGSVEMVKKEFKDVVLVENKENFGFSKANNIGVKKSKRDYFLFLNSDTEIKKDTLSIMLDFIKTHKDTGAVTCKVLLPNGELDDASHRGFPTPWNAFCHFSSLSKLFPKTKLFGGYNLGWMDLSQVHEIDACAGAFIIVRREAGEEVGWWDEDYFFYGEDLDFCYRLKEKGWKIYFVPTTSILHYKGVSSGIKKSSQELTEASDDTKTRATKARFEAMRVFYKKHYTNVYSGFITTLVNFGINLKEKLLS